MMQIKRFLLAILMLLPLSALLTAEEDIHPKETIVPTKEIHKRELLKNYTLLYKEPPGIVDNLPDMLRYGLFYWRVRSNTFYWDWRTEGELKDDSLITGLGASLIYKSSTLADFDFSLGGYFSQAFFDSDKLLINSLKPGKDLLSRYDYINKGKKSLAVIGQAYLRYSGFQNSKIRIGRQLVETFYTRSNDSKMIPNTFDGIVFDTHLIPHTKVRLAWLTRQKLRDHAGNHALFAYGDSNSSSELMPQWSENDDSVMHRGLTWSRLKAAGIDPRQPLLTGDLHSMALEGIRLDSSFYFVHNLLSQIMLETNWHYQPTDKLSIRPGIRFIQQFDLGAGAIGGASYSGLIVANSGNYKNPDSLNGQMIAARIIFEYGDWIANLGYSNILNQADLITPWRGFPTAGYTRSMGQYNWKANTQSYRIDIQHNLKQQGNYKNIFVEAALLHTNEDEGKSLLGSDKNNLYLGLIQNLPWVEDLQWRLRIGYTDAENNIYDAVDVRFELNYLF